MTAPKRPRITSTANGRAWERFAAAALTGLLADTGAGRFGEYGFYGSEPFAKWPKADQARWAAELADAMLAELEARDGSND